MDVTIIRDRLSIELIGEILADLVKMETIPLCVYGSDLLPKNAVKSSLLGDCLAENIYQIAKGRIKGPVYAGVEQDRAFCRCIGGPAWFGFEGFDPRLPSLISAVLKDDELTGKRLKESEEIAYETLREIGNVRSPGRYVMISRCDDLQNDPGVRCIICFASPGKIMDLCALAHFGSHEALNLISIPWGPACATLITYPAGMTGNGYSSRIFIGPTDPSSRQWLPEDCLAMGIPVEIARKMAEDADKSFLTKKDA